MFPCFDPGSLGDSRGEFTMRRFESSRPSQAVRRLETLPSVRREMPANGGLLRIGYPAPGSILRIRRSEIADSLRQIFDIFPFSGDRGRRPGSIYTAWPSLQCNSPNSRPWVVGEFDYF